MPGKEGSNSNGSRFQGHCGITRQPHRGPPEKPMGFARLIIPRLKPTWIGEASQSCYRVATVSPRPPFRKHHYGLVTKSVPDITSLIIPQPIHSMNNPPVLPSRRGTGFHYVDHAQGQCRHQYQFKGEMAKELSTVRQPSRGVPFHQW